MERQDETKYALRDFGPHRRCGGGRRGRLAWQPEEAARSTVVERGTMLVAVSASGSVEPQDRVNLAFEMP